MINSSISVIFVSVCTNPINLIPRSNMHLKTSFLFVYLPLFLLTLFPTIAQADWKKSYLAGENAMNDQYWEECVKQIQEAIKDKKKGSKKAKLYGMRFGYFPHLSLGICYENQGLWEEAEAAYKLSVKNTKHKDAKKRLKVAVVEADKVRRQKKLLKSWTDLYIFALEAMNKKQWETAVKHLRNSLKYRKGNQQSFGHLGKKVSYSPHLMIYKCYTNLKIKEENMIKELILSFENEKSDETEGLLAQYLPGIWVNP